MHIKSMSVECVWLQYDQYEADVTMSYEWFLRNPYIPAGTYPFSDHFPAMSITASVHHRGPQRSPLPW